MSETKTVKQTVVESGTEIEGIVRSQCAVVVSGNLKGEVSAPDLTITAQGSVHGKVKVSRLKAEGSLAGEIDAESVELSGSISDNTIIRATALEVKLSQAAGRKLQVSFGNCELQVGGPASKNKSEMHDHGHKKDQTAPEMVGAN